LTKNYFAVTWQNQDPKARVMGRRFDISGQALEDVFEISTHDFEMSFYPSLALNEAGKMVVAWHGWNPDYKTTSTLYQRSYLMSEPLSASLPLIPKPEPVCGPEYDTERLPSILPVRPQGNDYETGYLRLEMKRPSCLPLLLAHYEKYGAKTSGEGVLVEEVYFDLDTLSVDEAKRIIGDDTLIWDISDERLLKTFAFYVDIHKNFDYWLDDLYLVLPAPPHPAG